MSWNAYTLPFREALNDSISSGKFADTKITLYPRRSASGIITEPKTLYANSHVLRSVQYFQKPQPPEGLDPQNSSAPIDDAWEYDDSDLEDDGGDSNTGSQSGLKSRKGGMDRARDGNIPKLPDFNWRMDEPLNLDGYCGPPSDDSRSLAEGDGGLHEYKAFDDAVPILGQRVTANGKYTEIVICDVAFNTFLAFLMYLYTGSLEFAVYEFEGECRSRSTETISSSEDSVPRPSPMSIYRLADKYGVPGLKRLAREHISSVLERYEVGITEKLSRMVRELEESTGTLYEDRDKHLSKHLEKFWRDSKVVRELEESTGTLNEDRDKHLSKHLEKFWKDSKEVQRRLSKKAPLVPDTSRIRPTCYSENWELVETALIRSTRTGIFLDKEYWTRQSTTGRKLKPVYISSIIASKQLQYMDRYMVVMHPEGEPLVIEDEYEDSDCEDDSEQTSEPPSGAQPDKKKLPVLTKGYFPSWKSLFFYLCTGITNFASLTSDSVEVRAQRMEMRSTTKDKPSPCSPKSLYSLANMLKIKTLSDRALEDILLKLTEKNLRIELFSPFVHQHTNVQSRIESEAKTGRFGSVYKTCPESNCLDYRKKNKTSDGITHTNPDCRAYLLCSGCLRNHDDPKATHCPWCKRKFF